MSGFGADHPGGSCKHDAMGDRPLAIMSNTCEGDDGQVKGDGQAEPRGDQNLP
ncbi:hypothetical protein PGT21_005060 [Puccinia graminis f. sp. tritici]|uniref:Uncharacterized protein n=1 Tax=Puccinia graminis f. sp. tritici TaxID=56615 RepID=A0A5B0M1G9_PUCGR|nr:hypothetical protein PGTUg99_013294 [Puccinia graminis f. sp. tritici]KAA1099366.1 hypothetical protein PGT21_005060 [Puccinia graminis f. sp. tritici]